MKTIVLLTALLLTLPALHAAASAPNIVLILADDMGYSDIGCYGAEIATPNLDLLAKNGLCFSQFYNTGRCCPTRASLLTGLYPHQAGVGHMLGRTGLPGYQTDLRTDNVTIPELLKSAGYATFMCGKWHVGWAESASPTARGFGRFYGSRGFVDSYFTVVPRTDIYLDDAIVSPAGRPPVNHLHPDREFYTTDTYTDYALHFLDEHFAKTNAQPFFLYLAYNAPHWPLHAKPEDLSNYRGKYKTGWNDIRQQRLNRLIQAGLMGSSHILSQPDAPDWNSLSDEVKDELDLKMALYAAIVHRLDQNVGRLIADLKANKQLENTLIVFLSDNGGNREDGMWGYHGHGVNQTNYATWGRVGGRSSSYGQGWANVSNAPFRGYKRQNHEGGIATPCIVHWPAGGVKSGVTHEVGHVIDLLPTFAGVAGASYPAARAGEKVLPAEGRSLVPVLRGGTVGRRVLFWEHEGNRAVREGDWKLVAQAGQPWKLYDLSRDRTESVDLIAQEPGRAVALENAWNTWAHRANVLPWADVQTRMKEGRRQWSAEP